MSKKWHSKVRPPGSRRTFFLFTTRSPNRPIPVGIAVIKLDGIVESRLHVSVIDAFDGTPVLDIKPCLPSIDSPSHNGSLENEMEIRLGNK